MKKDREKRKHHESTIGKIIYGFLLFLPLLAIAVTCGYAMFNKNAYKSYEKSYIKSSTLYSNDSQDIIGEKYVLTSYENSNGNLKINYTEISIDWVTKLGASNQYNYDAFEMSQSYVYLYQNNVRVQTKQFTTSTFEPIYFTNNGMSSNFTYKVYLLAYQEATLSNVFYYSVDKVEQSNIFNWAKTSMIYTGMLNFTTAMNVTNTFMPMLLTYWLIISVIYFLYDIVLIILVVLHRKIHELQESI